MQAMRDVLRGTLGRSLRTLSDEDRLAAAWVVACGPALAGRAEVMGLDEDRVLHVRVLLPGWRDQFAQMRTMLTEELRKIAGVRLQTIHFEGQGSTRERRHDAATPGAKGSTALPAATRRNEQRKERRRSS
ncbi:MAG TPA: DciA family protein [Acidobacteriaceae bacterium]|nr:DciA family protein [Acidobacteriaceae bacterium]